MKKCRVGTLGILRLELGLSRDGEGSGRVGRIESVEGRRGREEGTRDERVNGGRGGITYCFHPERERERLVVNGRREERREERRTRELVVKKGGKRDGRSEGVGIKRGDLRIEVSG